jgi:hypothetical protein
MENELDVEIIDLSTPEGFARASAEALPGDIVKMLDETCYELTVLGVYQILHKRYCDDARAQKYLRRDLNKEGVCYDDEDAPLDNDNIPY